MYRLAKDRMVSCSGGVVLLLALLIMPAGAAAQITVCGVGGDYTTIQDAIDAATGGETSRRMAHSGTLVVCIVAKTPSKSTL